MSVANLYQQIVLDHHRAPRHYGALLQATHNAVGHNPLCGDHVRIELRIDEDVLRDISFSGESCAITTATASMMSERVIGLRREQIETLFVDFDASLRAGPGASASGDLGDLGELEALGELRRYPARLKCALLPWATLLAAWDKHPSITTETAESPTP
ncbi:SUF system NifU family Fe-S cluster assembly protein [Pseudolysobacter antarcticus]|uniref:SUF system NifU family Fe-S cluster assembly protein n=1 Tax=Pseudolysobacter antarcticus TaxID=2511995 RepID=A0A411HGP2_9GAMM|nr:SUF system NifU family Fe-S cluster assembly protein [Pseudolysobacter antarcticus]QBB69668.1 SUF system NifU family Fe-S cluster assembly protein [Pseudolysobacter antarcticus]